MLGYVVGGRVVPHSELTRNPFPLITAYFSDGSAASRAALNKIARRKKKRGDTSGVVIQHPTYTLEITKTTGKELSVENPIYAWDIIELFGVVEREIYCDLDFYVQSTKVENTPPVKLEGKSLATFMVLVEMLFGHLEQFEEKINTPVTVLEKLLRYTYYLSPESNDWNALAAEAGFDSVVYEPDYDVVRITCAGQTYPVKRPLLGIFANIVAPIVTKLLYRSSQLYVGTSQVDLCTFYYIKKQLDAQANVSLLGKDTPVTEAVLRSIHDHLGLATLLEHGTPLQ